MSSFSDALRAGAGTARILEEEPMSLHTSFKIGGPAEVLAAPYSAEEVSKLCACARRFSAPVLVMGNGTNLLVSDSGVRGLVIKLSGGLSGIELRGNELEAKAGTLLSKAAVFARDAHLSGLEFAHGIPGSVGGGVCMNAGAYGGEMKDIVVRSVCLGEEGGIFELHGKDHRFGYRRSYFTENPGSFILSTVFRLEGGDREEIQARMDDFRLRRSSTQPLEFPSAGSVFKRPEGYYAGKLITDSGLRGFQIGGARVSDIHAGFIINVGGATCDDVLRLISHIQETVYARFGVRLEREVRVIGA